MVREGRCERRDRGKCFEGRKWCSMFSLFMGNLVFDVSLVNYDNLGFSERFYRKISYNGITTDARYSSEKLFRVANDSFAFRVTSVN